MVSSPGEEKTVPAPRSEKKAGQKASLEAEQNKDPEAEQKKEPEAEQKKDPKSEQKKEPVKYLIRLNRFEASSETPKIAGSVEKSDLEEPLSSLRKTKIIPGRYAFCLQDQTPVQDSRSFKEYLQLNGLASPASGAEKKQEGEEPAASIAEKLSESPKGLKPVIINVYFRLAKLESDRPDAPDAPALPARLDASGQPLKPLPGQAATAFDASDWVVKAVSDAQYRHPATMVEAEWKSVLISNALMHGLGYREGHGVMRSRRPAFKLRSNLFDPYAPEKGEFRYSDESVITMEGIPEFQVFDDSSVSIVESSTALQRSMAQNGFDEWSAEASLSIDYGIVSGGASVSGGAKNASAQASTTDQTTKMLHASYKFPRVVVYFDEITVDLTDECKRAVNDICANYEEDGALPTDLVALFNNHFGSVFARCVHLGGRLHASKASSFVGGSSSTEKSSSMHASASASFKAPGFKASASASGASGSASQQNEMSSRQDENLCWEAVGGDTTLVSNPPLWASTVGDHNRWRVTMYHDLVPILDLIALIPGGRRLKLVLTEAATPAVNPLLNASSLRPASIEEARHFLIRNWKNGKNLVINRTEGRPISVEETPANSKICQFWFNNTTRTPIPVSFFDIDNDGKGVVDWTRFRIQWAGGSTFTEMTSQKPFILTRSSEDYILSSNSNSNNEYYFRFCRNIYDIHERTSFKDKSKGFICIIRRGLPRFLSHSKHWSGGSAPFFTIEQIEAKKLALEADILFPAVIILKYGPDGSTDIPMRSVTLPRYWLPDPDSKARSPNAFVDRGRSMMKVQFAADVEVTISHLETGTGLYFTTERRNPPMWVATLPPDWRPLGKGSWGGPKHIAEEHFEVLDPGIQSVEIAKMAPPPPPTQFRQNGRDALRDGDQHSSQGQNQTQGEGSSVGPGPDTRGQAENEDLEAKEKREREEWEKRNRAKMSREEREAWERQQRESKDGKPGEKRGF